MHINDYKLSDRENEYIYEHQIFPKLFVNGLNLNSPSPRVYYLGAQPGSGKTALARELLHRSENKNIVVINNDELRNFHPQYRQLLSHPTEYHRAPVLVNQDSTLWLQRAFADALKNRYNILFDSTLGNRQIDGFLDAMKMVKEKFGYGVELHVLAVNPEISKMGVYLRYESQLKNFGSGRFVEMKTHDLNFNMLPLNIEKILDSVNIDHLATYGNRISYKDGQLRSDSVRQLSATDNPCPKKDEIMKFLKKEWERPFENHEKMYFQSRYNQIKDMINQRGGDTGQFILDLKDFSRHQVSLDFSKLGNSPKL